MCSVESAVRACVSLIGGGVSGLGLGYDFVMVNTSHYHYYTVQAHVAILALTSACLDLLLTNTIDAPRQPRHHKRQEQSRYGQDWAVLAAVPTGAAAGVVRQLDGLAGTTNAGHLKSRCPSE
ncbi:hypothetical protein GMORB2_6101 [Geosmithia morbida]|uniref:Uncharacterized protein n=1 Tax=Geosmithia morbida TaxID=1094350 RepID=A0A9P4YWM5_9HYPO|nr:uncharacterized protein GMORB2_6101 [Geosmithia morbida]KAF4123400.1 hypothetical protein GMORB2_6101 [Geosmithia morbida]